MVSPPRSEDELLKRAHALAGWTIGEAAKKTGTDIPSSTARAKGLVGQLAEKVLGASAGSLDEPDFLEISVELKTLPLLPDGRPKESTFICTIKLHMMGETDFEDSLVWRKLKRVLFIPVEGDRSIPLPFRRFGSAILWSPTPAQRAHLQADYERVATLVLRGEVDSITGHLGTYLQVRPKGADGKVRKRAPDADDGYLWTGPRGFYLRTQLTQQILDAS
ncbi:MAG: DNA mismatch repair protein MutH [Myxococcota bacterium]